MNTANKEPVKAESKAGTPDWHPMETLRRQIDRLFDDFDFSPRRFGRTVFDIEPFWRRELSFGVLPAIDIVEKDQAYEISAELPGMDEKNIEIKLVNGLLTIKGEKTETKEEKKKDRYLSERHYGAFQRSFRVPEDVDADKIDARFDKGVLTVSLPKAPGGQVSEKKIAVKTV